MGYSDLLIRQEKQQQQQSGDVTQFARAMFHNVVTWRQLIVTFIDNEINLYLQLWFQSKWSQVLGAATDDCF